MKIAAIICEYDPFHHGHAYHIEKTRQAGATHVVCIMSGAFVERATPAAVSRAARVKAALLGGADLVIDLPVPWACAGAQIFARGGVGLADALGCVELLSFGSECGNIGLIKTAARAINDPAVFALLKENLDSGESFAAIRQKAVEAVFPQVAGLLSNPNDTLGIEYVAALEALGSSVEPMCVSRKGAPHDSNVTDGIFASASAVRKLMTAGESFENLVPKGAYEIFLHEVEEGRAPAEVSRLESAILYKLRTSSPADFRKLPDVSEGIENRIVSAAKSAVSLDDVYSFAKTKRYSHARLRRIVTSLMLGIEKSDRKKAEKEIIKQFNEIAHGNVDEAEFNAAKKSIVNVYSETTDSASGMVMAAAYKVFASLAMPLETANTIRRARLSETRSVPMI